MRAGDCSLQSEGVVLDLRRALPVVVIAVCILAGLTGSWVGAGTTGIISGTVKSADNGSVISGVNVTIVGTKLSTVTDASGKFVITNVPPGDYDVKVDMVGYAPKTQGSVQVTMDTTSTADFDLTQQAIQEQAALISRPQSMIAPDVVNTLTQVTSQQETLTREDPGNLHTAPGVLSALPGVIVDPDGSGQMHMRGGKPDQVGWFIEGIPITDPNIGMFGTNLFTTGASKFQVYSGGFGAEFGNAISGALNEVLKTGADSSGMNLDLEGGNTAYRSGIGEFGGGSADQFNYYVGLNSFNSNLDAPIVKQESYTDNAIKLVWPSSTDKVTLLSLQGTLFGTLDAYHDTGDNGVATPNEKDFMQQKYAFEAVTLNHSYSPKSFIEVTPYYQYTNVMDNLIGTYGVYQNFLVYTTGNTDRLH